MEFIRRGFPRFLCAAALCASISYVLAPEASAQTAPAFLAHKEFIAATQLPQNLESIPGLFAQGDVNGDGINDLIVPSFDQFLGEQVAMLMIGNRNGTFQAPITFSTGGTATRQAVIGDFNRDGKNDVAFALSGGTSVLLGDGRGGFGAPLIIPTSTLSTALVTGDFNGDGKLDLAVANGTKNTVSIVLGNGDGTFNIAATLTVGNSPIGIAAGDLNGDGHLDLAVTNNGSGTSGNSVSVLLGIGNGQFQPASNIPVATGPMGIAIADLNHDNKPDLVVTNSGTDQVSIILGKGNGTFGNPKPFTVRTGVKPPSGYFPDYVSVDDFNADGNPDLVVANLFSSTATILLGDGKGAVGKPLNLLVGATPLAVLTGDFNHDGRRDFITSNQAGGTVSLYLGKGNGTFQGESSFPSQARADQIAVADFNNDGISDIATANGGLGFNGNTVSVFLGKGNGTFGAESVLSTGRDPNGITAADFNGDGNLDLAVSDGFETSGNKGLMIFLGNGDGTFVSGPTLSGLSAPKSSVAADFNQDGKMDLAVCTGDERGATLLLGDGKGGFPTSSTIKLSSACLDVLTADYNRDGKPDLAFRLERGPETPITFIALNTGNGTFGAATSITPFDAFGIATGDLNNDGIPDVVVFEAGVLEALIGDGTGKFTSKGFVHGPFPTLFHFSQNPIVADLNGDGFQDVAICDEAGHTLSVLLAKSDGSLADELVFAGGGDESSAVAAGDFNRDGLTDLVLSGLDDRNSKGIVTILRGVPPPR